MSAEERAVSEFKDRTVLVTGAGRGIGRTIASSFAGEGARVAVATRTAASGRDTVEQIRAAGGTAELFVVDVAIRQAVRQLVLDVVAHFGNLDIVIHNAATLLNARLIDLTEEDLDRVIDVNVKAAFWLAQDAIPHLTKSPTPRLLYVSSIVGNRISNYGLSAYGASKAALNGFIRHAGGELAALGIRVNGVEPGSTRTDQVMEMMGSKLDDFGRLLPAGRVAEPADIAAALMFLAGASGNHIAGQTIVVDGGQSLGCLSGPQ
jgi:3-oxoacyl-[acyl-carrier protein] reductase